MTIIARIRALPSAIKYASHEAANAWRRYWWLTVANRNPDEAPF